MFKRLILCTLGTLAISACAPSGSEGEDCPENIPFGYEFADTDEQVQERLALG
ncbi:MAG: hypothetical protein ABJ205_11685 [Erythrobacter sp.]|uniref:hypothetical protein n=1 Tax=Erythrobacter sp. TaxID=1042 RepID=UPI003263B130